MNIRGVMRWLSVEALTLLRWCLYLSPFAASAAACEVAQERREGRL